MYSTILMPVDGSDVSNHALEEGLSLAKALGSRVILVYIVDMTIAAMPEAELGVANAEIMRRSFIEQGNNVIRAAEAAARAKGVPYESVIEEGDVHDGIVETADKRGVELVVMGTHGRRGLNRLLLGSVAQSVTKRAHCPVLLIRPG